MNYAHACVDGSRSLDIPVTTPAGVEVQLREDILRHALAKWRADASFRGGTYSPDLMIDTLLLLARISDMPNRVEVLQHLENEIIKGLWRLETGPLLAQASVLVARLLARSDLKD